MAASLAAGTALVGSAAHADQVQLLETGSTLLLPLFNQWAADYQKAHPDVQIATQGTGSGAGISQAVSGAVQIGASDAYMSDAQMKASPGILNIPLAISSQMINYNLPGLNDQHLKFSGPVLAAIYAGKVKYWDDPMIVQLNAGVKLPHNQIVPVHRTDGSGDTFIFTQYLSFSTPEWSKSAGYGLDGELAGGARRRRRYGQSGHGQRIEEHALFDRLCRHQLQKRDRRSRSRRGRCCRTRTANLFCPTRPRSARPSPRWPRKRRRTSASA